MTDITFGLDDWHFKVPTLWENASRLPFAGQFFIPVTMLLFGALTSMFDMRYYGFSSVHPCLGVCFLAYIRSKVEIPRTFFYTIEIQKSL